MHPRAIKRLGQLWLALALILCALSTSRAAGILKDSAPSGAIALAATCQGVTYGNVAIEDSWAYNLCVAPWAISHVSTSCGNCSSGAVIGSVVLDYTIPHTCPRDLEVQLCDEAGCYTVWNRAGICPSDAIVVTGLAINAFNGRPVDQRWELQARDCYTGDTGYIDQWHIKINYSPVLAAPTPYSPLDGQAICNATPTFSWSALGYAGHYYLKVAGNPSLDPTEISIWLGNVTSYQPSTALPAGVHYWSVAGVASDCGVIGAWSSVRSLTIGCTTPTATRTATRTPTRTATPAAPTHWAYLPLLLKNRR